MIELPIITVVLVLVLLLMLGFIVGWLLRVNADADFQANRYELRVCEHYSARELKILMRLQSQIPEIVLVDECDHNAKKNEAIR